MDAARLTEAARRSRRIGVLGGSFDPPHLGHLHVARTAREAFDLDHVVFVPAARPPHKPLRVLSAGEERSAMLELLLTDVAWASIWRGELAREGPSFTIHTLEAFRDELSAGIELFLLIGGDNLAGLPEWYRVEELLALARPVVVRRRGSSSPAGFPARLSVEARARLEAGRLDVEPFDASASELRERLRAGEDPGPALPEPLREYIRARGIYGAAGR